MPSSSNLNNRLGALDPLDGHRSAHRCRSRIIRTYSPCRCDGIGRDRVLRSLAEAPISFVYLAALCLGLRFVSESALEGYYVWPALALFVLTSGADHLPRFKRTRLVSTGRLAIGLTVATVDHFGSWWTWWTVSVFGLGAAALTSLPHPRNGTDRDLVGGEHVRSRMELDPVELRGRTRVLARAPW